MDLTQITSDNRATSLAEVQSLRNISLQDDVPHIQMEPQCIEIDLANNFNPVAFLDQRGYESPYNTESLLAGKLEASADLGRTFINFMYTYRSISNAIPDDVITTTTDGQEIPLRPMELNHRLSELLRPSMSRLLELYGYVTGSIQLLYELLSFLATPRLGNPLPSDALLDRAVTLLDTLIILDNLKERKTAYVQDFERFKAALGNQLSPTENEEINVLNTLLMNSDPIKSKNFVYFSMKEQVKRVVGCDDLLATITEYCLKQIEASFDNTGNCSSNFLAPDDLFRHVRALPYLLALMDGPAEDLKANVFNFKKIHISPIQKIFRRLPVVPLCGDMTLTLVSALELAPHFTRTTMSPSWGDVGENSAPPAEYKLITHWKIIREENAKLAVQLALLINKLRVEPFSKALELRNIQVSAQACELSVNCCRAIAKWHSSLMLVLAWKYVNPASMFRSGNTSPIGPFKTKAANPTFLPSLGLQEGQEYESAVRCNLSTEELSMVIDIISSIKGLVSSLLAAESTLAPILRFHMHHATQQVVQGDLLPLLHRVDKRNKISDLAALLQLRTIAADWPDGVEPANTDYKDYSRKKGSVEAKHTPRVVAPSHTQIYLFRATLRHLSHESAPLRQRKGLLSSAEMEATDVKLFEDYLAQSLHFPRLLAFHETLRQLGDLSALWYRETFLELTGCVQFQIDLSLPWLLVEHAIESPRNASEAPLIECVLFILDLYNDAAQRALFDFSQQHLYDEAEAEANLVLDQVLCLLSEDLYGHYKALTGCASLDKALKHRLEELRGTAHLTVSARRYETIALQRHARLLGRIVNFNYLMGQYITRRLGNDLDLLLRRFESNSFEMGIIELKNGLLMLRRLHGSLSELFELESFDVMLSTVGESTPLTGYRGRVSVHVLRSLIEDIFSNYSYNFYTQRFVPSPVAIKQIDYGRAPKSSTLSQLYGVVVSKAFDMTLKLTRGFLGQIHIEALLELAPLIDVSVLIVECLGFVTLKLKEIADYAEALREGIPPTRLPKYVFKAGGCYGFFEGKLRSVLEYPGLKSDVFQAFRECGNALCFLYNLSEALAVSDQTRFINLAPLLGTEVLQGGPLQPSDSPLVQVFESLDEASLPVPSTVRALLPDLAQDLYIACSDAINFKSVFVYCLSQVREAVTHFQLDRQWACTPLDNNLFIKSPYCGIETEHADGFHKIWSALSFLFSVHDAEPSISIGDVESNKGQPVSDEGEFGHGFSFAGCLFVHLMGQRVIYELLDYSYHVLSVNQHDKLSPPSPSNAKGHTAGSPQLTNAGVGSVDPLLQQAADRFILSATEQRQLHTQLFQLFEAHLPVKPETLSLAREISTHGVVLYRPPRE